jgi:hypothetical protein
VTFASLVRWITEEHQIRSHRREMAKLDREHEAAIKKAKADGRPGYEISQLDHEHYAFWVVPSDKVDVIRSNRLVQKARNLGLPVPRHDNEEFWEKSTFFYEYMLTAQGSTHLRREIALEKEIRQKPWLNWISLFISGISFAVALFTFLWTFVWSDTPPPV